MKNAWTEDHDAWLTEMVDEGLSKYRISVKFNRTVLAVENRICGRRLNALAKDAASVGDPLATWHPTD